MSDEARVRELGEFGLIARLQATLPDSVRANDHVILGIGDDAAVWQPSPVTHSVITTDTLIEDVHFRLDWTDWRSLGHKMLAVNLSDIAAMGGTPLLTTITLGLNGNERVDDLENLYRGAGELAEAHRVVIAGGDIVRTAGPRILAVTVVGEARRILRRDDAQVGDRIVVSGTLGASAAGLRLLQDPALRQRATTADLLVAAQLRPNPRIALGQVLADSGAHAVMDLSDGLLGDLPKLLHASGSSARIDARKVPVVSALRALFPDAWLEMALRGGEDYELLATVPADALDHMVTAAAGIGATLTDIGEVTAREGPGSELTLTDLDGKASVVQAGAYDHFMDDGPGDRR